jgi:hypothetical protein
MPLLEIEINFEPLPSEAPAWAVHLQKDIHVMLMLQLHMLRKLGHIDEEIKMTDRTVDEVLADIQEESTQIAGLSTLTADIKAKLDAALAGTTIPADVQAKINSIFDGVEANKKAVMDAINANTDAHGSDPTAPVGS